MNTKAKTILFFIGLTVFIILVSEFGIQKIFENIKKTGWWFLPVISIWGFVYIVNTFAWYFIVDAGKYHLTFPTMFRITVSGFAINYITPFVNLGGEPYRIVALKDITGLSKSISSVTTYTILHFLSHFLFWILAIILSILVLSLSYELKSLLIMVLVILLIFSYLIIRKREKGFVLFFVSYLAKVPGIQKLITKMEIRDASVKIVDEMIEDFFSNRRTSFYASLGLDLLSRFISVLEFYFILHAININATLLQSFFIAAGSSLIMNLFFFIPLTLGVREGGLLLMMQLLNFSPGIGIYISIVNRIREFFWIFIGLIFIQLFKKKSARNLVINE